VKVAAALVLLSPFTPMLFMGEEWAASTPWQYFTDHRDPQLAESVRHGRRNEFKAFGWEPSEVPDPQDPETMQRSVLNWAELERDPHADVLAWHRSLIALRRSRPELLDGSFADVDVDEAARTLVMRRGPVTLIADLSPTPTTLSTDATRLLLSSSSASLVGGLLTLPGESVAILDRGDAAS
jgi:maltooligosyltrehalose trehalohydrolase